MNLGPRGNNHEIKLEWTSIQDEGCRLNDWWFEITMVENNNYL
jgi:hypothetical protein